MRTRRSLKLVLAVAAALLAAGTTFAWAGVLVGGHRADHIGTFEPVARRLVPAPPSAKPTAPPAAATGASTGTRASESSTFLTPATRRTTTSPGEVTATTTRHSDDPKTTTTDDNGRHNDD
jgi:hypothetical protein